jgi:putative endonuclease
MQESSERFPGETRCICITSNRIYSQYTPGGRINWSVYIIEASDHSYYTGISTDVERRFDQHCSGPLGAKFFNGRTPLKVVYREDGHTRSTASKREIEIKKLTRMQKQALLAARSGD